MMSIVPPMITATEPWGARIRSIRLDNDWTQEEIAARAGLSQRELSHIELGHRKALDPAIILRLASALDVEPADIWNWVHSSEAVS